jgi:hypothetical protein
VRFPRQVGGSVNQTPDPGVPPAHIATRLLFPRHLAASVLAVSLVGAELRPAAAQQPDPAGPPPVRRVLAALRPDLELRVFRTLATGDISPGLRVAVVAGAPVPHRREEWLPETWALVLLDTQTPTRTRVLDTLRAYEVRAAIEYAAADEVIVRREGVDYGENMFDDQYRQYFVDSLTGVERGRRIYREVTAASPVAVQDSVFAAVTIVPCLVPTPSTRASWLYRSQAAPRGCTSRRWIRFAGSSRSATRSSS